ncbi:uncharacterized protein LOC128554417 [Mercenaria mercenaria]|uniref:uncharacterized protein LOC128554417 n=1 Tax=Mercenaria mercenaria TaxID=6596 RepID=UPI00234F4671|nr:uncharacterized protein LOC128554417 [Mercenaria mercenaria]
MKKNIDKLEQEKNSLQGENSTLSAQVSKLALCLQQEKEKATRNTESLKEAMESERRLLNQKLTEMEKEKNDLRDRFSKVAGQKLAEKNADIADLSDPNRAMKLSERFSQIYDDDWTDAFQALGDRKMKSKEAIQVLMTILKCCYDTCEEVAAQQLEELKIPLIQPVKTVGEASKGHAVRIIYKYRLMVHCPASTFYLKIFFFETNGQN